MRNVLIDDELPAKGLTSVVRLRALVPDTTRYSVMFIQPSGVVSACGEFIKNADENAAKLKHLSFLRLASAEHADLVVAPEYSCPWAVVEDAIGGGVLPDEGALWVLGCESITVDELRALMGRLTSVKWICEDIPAWAGGKFLDPVCYLFYANDNEGESHLVCVVQFKGEPMSASATLIEQEEMIRGEKRYVLRNDNDSVHLTTLICSDALTFGEPQLDELPPSQFHPYLILHPQLNTGPFHPTFALYRKVAYGKGGEHREVICINWAKGFSIKGKPLSLFGGSALYTKSQKLELGDGRLDSNHRKGMYYSKFHPHRAHIYFFNYNEHVFFLRTTKPSLKDAVPLSQLRSGPKMESVYSWNPTSNAWEEVAEADDGFNALCEANFNCDLSPLSNGSMSPTNKERLLALTAGRIEGAQEWYTPEALASFRVGEDEVMQRGIVVQDPCPEAMRKRLRRLARFRDLRNTIILDVGNFPRPIQDLAGDCEISYPDAGGEYHYNLWKRDRSRSATVAFVGISTFPDAKRSFDKIYEAVPLTARSRVVVWYIEGLQVRSISEDASHIAHDVAADPRSIWKER
jgi:hypothetical protein